MNTNRIVRITKIKSSENPEYPSKSLQDHEHGEVNHGFSLPIEYYVEGTMENPPVVGKSFTMFRSSRNGVKVSGVFTTSEVTKVTDDGFETLNSIYKIQDIA